MSTIVSLLNGLDVDPVEHNLVVLISTTSMDEQSGSADRPPLET